MSEAGDSRTIGWVHRIGVVLEMIKFSHTIFALPFALSAGALATKRAGEIRWLDVAGVLVCMACARSAAMAYNRLVDRDVDAKNPRTAGRALPAGLASPAQVVVFTVVSSAGFFLGTSLFYLASGNTLPMILAGPVLAFLLGYSHAKRWTWLAHCWLGAALALAPISAWLAILGEWAWEPTLLGLAVAGWVAGFDVVYACQDLEVDRELGLWSIPARFGYDGAMWFARAFHLFMLVMLAAFRLATEELGFFFDLGLAATAALIAVEHWLVRKRDLARINLAFFQVNAVISSGLLLAVLLDLAVG